MQVIPDQKNSRLTAILLLAIVLILGYLVFFHWFFLRHSAYSEEIGDLQEQLDKRLGSLRELFGVLQQVAGDTRGLFEGSVISAEFPTLTPVPPAPAATNPNCAWFAIWAPLNGLL